MRKEKKKKKEEKRKNRKKKKIKETEKIRLENRGYEKRADTHET